MEKKTALLIAGGGTIGTYAALELKSLGFSVDIICRVGSTPNEEDIT